MSQSPEINITGLNLQIDEKGNIVGIIDPEKLVFQLNTLRVFNKVRFFSFVCDKRRNPRTDGKPDTHVGPKIIAVNIPHTNITYQSSPTSEETTSFFNDNE